MSDLPEISDETVKVFLRAAVAAGAGAYISGGQGRLEVNDDHVRAGLSAALVASGYRREGDVRAEIATTLRSAAAGRREYAKPIRRVAAFADAVACLDQEAATIEAAARVVEGDIQPLYGWLPSRRWTDEMVAKLHGDRASALEPAQPLPVPETVGALPVVAGSEAEASCQVNVWGGPYRACGRTLVNGKCGRHG